MFEFPNIPIIGQGIYLRIQRTVSNRRRCTYPGCENKGILHNVSRHVRFKAMKDKKIYIPNKARACVQHLNAWDAIDGDAGRRTKFNAEQIEDMVQLICDSGPKNTLETG